MEVTVETVTPGQAADAGLSRSGLYRAATAGRFERIARGLYRPADAAPADWDWIEAASRRRDATVCLTSGLAYYDLTDAIPRTLDIAIPRGSRVPAGVSAISWHLFDRATFGIGRDAIDIPGTSMPIGIYSAERCIVDAFRLRGEVGYELGRDALREWLRRGGKPGQLMEIATVLPRAKEPLLRMLEALE
jgi:predicted transcriptional regulator of viral defense system